MKYLTYISRPGANGSGLTDFFPSLSEYTNSGRVKLCGYRAAKSMEFLYYNTDIIVIAMYGDYEPEQLDDIMRLSRIRPGQHVIVPSPLAPPIELPDNVHWLTFKSMYSIYAKNSKFIEQDRPAIKKHFISLNHRHMWFRQELLYFLKYNNLLDSTYFSYTGNDRFNEGARKLFDQADQVIGSSRYTGLNRDDVYDMLPYKNFVEINPPENNKQVVDFCNIQDLYNTAAVGIESETYLEKHLDNNPGLTEKTMRPLMLGNPFLTYSNRGTLKTLREMGFETFGNIIDESYDDIFSPQQRWEAILDQVTALSKSDPQGLINQVVDVCKYNQNHMLVTLQNSLEEDDQTIYNLIRSLL